MADDIQTMVVALTPDEVDFIMNALLTCQIQTNVRSMPAVLATVQAILKKLQPEPETPAEAEPPKED